MYTLEKWKEKSNLIHEVAGYFLGGNMDFPLKSSIIYSYIELVQLVLMKKMSSVDPLTLESWSQLQRDT